MEKLITHASVFSGIGGPEVAAAMLGWENVFHCEINPFGKAVLDYWFPNAESYEDITKTDFRKWRGRVSVLTGGFPCQPFSYAGKRRGAEDDRYLWPSMYRAIDEIQPAWVIAENVAGILTMVEQGEVSQMAEAATLFGEDNGVSRYELRETYTLQRICTDLESHGYAVQPILIPACGVGAPHRRDRVFIIGRRVDAENALRYGCGERNTQEQGNKRDERDTCTGDNQRVRNQGARACVTGVAANPGNARLQETGAEFQATGNRGSGLRDAADTEGEQGKWGGFIQREHSQQEQEQFGGSNRKNSTGKHIADTRREGLERKDNPRCAEKNGEHIRGNAAGCDRKVEQGYGKRWATFPSVSPVHRGNDGLPFPVDNLTIPFGKWRTEALKAYGNAIVPQVMYEIFRAIDEIERS